jgi:hypothetical protein
MLIAMRPLLILAAGALGGFLVVAGLIVPLCCARPCPEGVSCYPPDWTNEAVFFAGVVLLVAAFAAGVVWAWRRRG